MSPPIRDGSGSSIGSIRLGDGSEISEVRTGAGDVLFSATTIPDSVVSRDPDDVTNTNSGRRGIEISLNSNWLSIGVEISGNAPDPWDAQTAELLRVSDSTTIDTVDISGLTAGDTFTFDNVDIKSGNNYTIVAYNDGNSYTTAGDTNASFPYTSTDVDIVDGVKGDGFSSADPTNFLKVGNVGF